MSGKKIFAGLIQNTDLKLKITDNRESLCLELVENIRTACPDLSLEYIIPGDDIEFTQEQLTKLASLEIVICDQRIFRKPDLLSKLPNVKWVQSFWAGVDVITRGYDSKLDPPFILTRNGDFFDSQLVEYAIGMILLRERHFFQLILNQKQNLWKQVLPSRQISNLTLGIVGFGTIGKNLAKVARAFKMKVLGLVRTVPVEEQSDEAEYHLTSSLPELLSSCDYVCSILPAAPSTDGIFDGDVLSHCKEKKSVFMNIGRGNVVQESTIINALDQGWISHAILDVFETEPLPATSPLWAHPNVTLTPHQAGLEFDAKLFAENFAKNYLHFVNGEQMDFEVNWKKGY